MPFCSPSLPLELRKINGKPFQRRGELCYLPINLKQNPTAAKDSSSLPAPPGPVKNSTFPYGWIKFLWFRAERAALGPAVGWKRLFPGSAPLGKALWGKEGGPEGLLGSSSFPPGFGCLELKPGASPILSLLANPTRGDAAALNTRKSAQSRAQAGVEQLPGGRD